MTKQLKSGKEKVSLKDRFITHDDTHSWEGQEIEVHSDPLIDEGKGDNILLRVFDFGANPENLKRDKPTKQQLFDSHVRQIMTMLWSDGLEPAKDINPLIQVSKKKEKYRILMWCRAKAGVVWSDAPRKLQDIIKPHGN